MVAQMSSRVFLGKEICRDEEWLNVSVNFTIDAFIAARVLRLWPPILRPVVHWFLPWSRRMRKHIQNSNRIVQGEVHKRELIREGKLPDTNPGRHPDSLDWCQEVAAGRPFDMILAQLRLSVASIHTTSNLLTNVMYDLAAYPEHIQPLRDEIKAVVEEDGMLKKAGLAKMKLMDSVLKESQRLRPSSMGEYYYPSSDWPSLTANSFNQPGSYTGHPPFRRNHHPQGSRRSSLRPCDARRIHVPRCPDIQRLPLLQQAPGTRARKPPPIRINQPGAFWLWTWCACMPGAFLCSA